MNVMNTTPAQHHTAPRTERLPIRLRHALYKRDLSIAQAARILGWTQSNFQRQVRGTVKLSTEQLEWIEARLGIPMDYLLSFREKDPIEDRIFGQPLRPESPLHAVPDAGEVLFYDGSGEPKSTASKESFLRESNSRPFHYKAESSSTNTVGKVLPFRPRTTESVKSYDKGAQIVPFPSVGSL